jgi:hypothetical protein
MMANSRTMEGAGAYAPFQTGSYSALFRHSSDACQGNAPPFC